MPHPVLVVGGLGFFGRAVVDDLLERTTASIIIAGRLRRIPLWHDRLSWRSLDVAAPPPLTGLAAVVNCAGPFQGMSTAIVEAAARACVPYIDLADDRDFARRARAVPSPAPKMIGLSAVSGLTCLLAGRAGVGRLRRVRTIIAPGSRPPRGGATMTSLLTDLHRWGARERVRFPPPVGTRHVYRAIETGDIDGVPCAFEFKVGFDLDLFNRGVEVMRAASFVDPLRHLSAIRAAVRCLSVFGTEAGAVMVQAEGDAGAYEGVVLAREGGYRIPAMLAAIATARILDGRLRDTNPASWLPDLSQELSLRGVQLLEARKLLPR